MTAPEATGPLPALFVTHGAPTLPIEPGPAHDFLAGLGESLARPTEILCISAHWECPEPSLSAVERPATIHDFYGFPPALYALDYPAPGAPDLAQRAGALLQAAGLGARIVPDRGLDHGAWVPLMLSYPDADIPVTQLSVQSALGPEHHLALGRALAPLRNENVLILASGSATHDLSAFRGQPVDTPPVDYALSFDDWLVDAVAEGRTGDLLAYRERAPFAARNHPSEEHFLPLFVALGAGMRGDEPAPARLLHRSMTYGIIAMTAFAFG
jgi:4,5-DOPA dioxygenase extradiol